MVETLMTLQKYNGFTLLEILIYILFFSFITLAASMWIARLWQFSMLRSKKQESLITLYCAHDVLIRDLRAAPSDPTQWKATQENCIIWHTKNGDIGWLQDNDQLIRIEGRYNNTKKKWTKKTKSIIAKKINNVQFHMVGDTCIELISFTIADDTTSVENIISPLCKPLPWKQEKT